MSATWTAINFPGGHDLWDHRCLIISNAYVEDSVTQENRFAWLYPSWQKYRWQCTDCDGVLRAPQCLYPLTTALDIGIFVIDVGTVKNKEQNKLNAASDSEIYIIIL